MTTLSNPDSSFFVTCLYTSTGTDGFFFFASQVVEPPRSNRCGCLQLHFSVLPWYALYSTAIVYSSLNHLNDHAINLRHYIPWMEPYLGSSKYVGSSRQTFLIQQGTMYALAICTRRQHPARQNAGLSLCIRLYKMSLALAVASDVL